MSIFIVGPATAHEVEQLCRQRAVKRQLVLFPFTPAASDVLYPPELSIQLPGISARLYRVRGHLSSLPDAQTFVRELESLVDIVIVEIVRSMLPESLVIDSALLVIVDSLVYDRGYDVTLVVHRDELSTLTLLGRAAKLFKKSARDHYIDAFFRNIFNMPFEKMIALNRELLQKAREALQAGETYYRGLRIISSEKLRQILCS